MDPVIQKRLFVGLLLVMALVMFLTAVGYLNRDRAAERLQIHVMTSLPLKWGEGDVRAVIEQTSTPSAAYQKLTEDFDVELIDNFADLTVEQTKILIMVQPRALAAIEMVQLDAWVKEGGRLLVFADPALRWDSIYPMGDPRRPLFTSLLSPIFTHWGVELQLPMDNGGDFVPYKFGKYEIRTVTPGSWRMLDQGVGGCRVGAHFLVANCTVGRGQAVLVADADLFDDQYWHGTALRQVIARYEFDNMQWVTHLIDQLGRRDIVGTEMGNSGQ